MCACGAMWALQSLLMMCAGESRMPGGACWCRAAHTCAFCVCALCVLSVCVCVRASGSDEINHAITNSMRSSANLRYSLGSDAVSSPSVTCSYRCHTDRHPCVAVAAQFPCSLILTQRLHTRFFLLSCCLQRRGAALMAGWRGGCSCCAVLLGHRRAGGGCCARGRLA